MTPGNQYVLECLLDEAPREFTWTKDHVTYDDDSYSPIPRQSVIRLDVSTSTLNGSVIECWATFGEGTDLVLQRSWVIIVEKGEN